MALLLAEVVVRPVRRNERAAWAPLWDGYLKFYKATCRRRIPTSPGCRLHDAGEPMHLLGAYVDGKLTGIVHYLFHRSTWMPDDYCYLQDLSSPTAPAASALAAR